MERVELTGSYEAKLAEQIANAPRGWKLSTPWAYFILGAIAVLVLESLFAFFLPELVNGL